MCCSTFMWHYYATKPTLKQNKTNREMPEVTINPNSNRICLLEAVSC